MGTLREILDPAFLLRNSVYVSLLIGFTCPLVGVYLVLRRLIFMGVALPQVSSAGIAFAFSLPSWGVVNHLHFGHIHGDERLMAFVGGFGLTLVTLLLLAFFERRGQSPVEGRLGTLYVLAGAWSILFLVKNPLGERGLLDLLRGEIIAVPTLELWFTLAAMAVVVVNLLVFQKEFLLTSFDRDMAVTMKKSLWFWDSFLFVLVGLAISTSVLGVGPMVTFGFLLLPPLIARLFARNMRQFYLLASAVGGLTALFGFCAAYSLDYPVGPIDVALLGFLYAVAATAKYLFNLACRDRVGPRTSPSA